MKSIHQVALVAILAGLCSANHGARAAFHLMQIEQVIGGVNDDTTAQAIQLRFRNSGQNVVSLARIRAWDAMGANPITIIDMGTDVDMGLTGGRVLIRSNSFLNYLDPNSFGDPNDVADFTMTNTIPASYLNAGRLTFENDFGNQLWWVLAWGGTDYTGATTGLAGSTNIANDANGNFGPPFAGALPFTSLQALQFTGLATAQSTTNAEDYAITAATSTWVNNANASFTLFDPPDPEPDPNSADFDGDDDVDGQDFLTWQRNFGASGEFEDGDADHDGDIDADDLAIWEGQYGTDPPFPLDSVAAVPEPNAAMLLVASLAALKRRRARRGVQCP